MAPVVKLLAKKPGVISRVCVTAQHREMLDQVLDLFDIQPDYDLDLMRPNQSLAELTAGILTHLDLVFSDARPDWVLVQGDTTTVMAAALQAYYHRIKVGHIEAGLRTGNKWEPFPEEVNRKLVSSIADMHFAPTEWARANLLRENVPEEKIFVTGNPVIDALKAVAAQPYTPEIGTLTEIPPECKILLITAHRRENFGAPMESICEALLAISRVYQDSVHIVYPVHLNPNVQEPVYRLLKGVSNIHLLPPMDYLPFVNLMKRSYIILTDSGGLQEEAPGLGKPVLVMRKETERPEGVQAGTVKLVGTRSEKIIAEVRLLLDNPSAYRQMAQAANPYGDGQAAERIVNALLKYPPDKHTNG